MNYLNSVATYENLERGLRAHHFIGMTSGDRFGALDHFECACGSEFVDAEQFREHQSLRLRIYLGIPESTISAVPATPQSAERGADNSQTGTSSPSFSPDPSEHFRAPENMEELCHLCGEKIAPGSIIVDAQIRGEAAYAHEACIEEREDDMREEGGAL